MINERLTGWETQLSQQLNADAIQLGISWGLHCFSLVGSTMDSARELLESVDTTHPTLVLASQQMSGRGRQGRNWLASRLGFYGTYAFCLPAGRQLRSGFPLVTGALL